MFKLFGIQSYLALILDCDSFEVCLLLFLSLEHVEEFGNFQESARARVNLKVKQELLQKSNKSDFKSQARVTSKVKQELLQSQTNVLFTPSYVLRKIVQF